MNKYDHHNGKIVKKTTDSTITFEDGHTIDVPGEKPDNLAGLALLMVEGTESAPILVFGRENYPQTAIRVYELPAPSEEAVEALENDSEATDAKA